MELSSLGGFLGFLGACFAAAASGAVFTPGPWYDALARPRWCPPNWLFAPAWAVLFLKKEKKKEKERKEKKKKERIR